MPYHATTALLLTNSKRPSRAGAVLRTSVHPVEQRTRLTRVTVISDAARVRRSFAVRARPVHVNWTSSRTHHRLEFFLLGGPYLAAFLFVVIILFALRLCAIPNPQSKVGPGVR